MNTSVYQQPQGLGFAVPAVAVKGASLLSHVLGIHIGGHSQAEKDAERVRRGNELYQCAAAGDVMAARTILFSKDHSNSSVGREHYAELWAELQQQYPSIAQQAEAAGPTGDTKSTGCYAIVGTPAPVPVTSAAQQVAQQLAAQQPAGGAAVQTSSIGGSLPVVLGAGAVLYFLARPKGRRR